MIGMRAIKTVVLLSVLLSSTVLADESAVQLKDGAGRDLIERNCIACHSLDYIPMNSPFLDRKGWEGSVTKMINAMGAPIAPEDVPAMVDYLVRNYGKP